MNWLEIARKNKNLSLAELARRTKICPTRLSRIENGVFLPTPEQSRALARELGLSGIPSSQDLVPEHALRGLARPYQLETYSQERWQLALKLWRNRIHHLAVDPRTLALMCQLIRVDSALEALAWILLAAAGARFFLGNPHRWGYRHHRLTDSLGHCLGERNLPGLQYQAQLWIWPQVIHRPSEISLRPDALVLHASNWLRMEINGDGHNQARDNYRMEQLKLPTISLTEKEIQNGKLVELILRRASECR